MIWLQAQTVNFKEYIWNKRKFLDSWHNKVIISIGSDKPFSFHRHKLAEVAITYHVVSGDEWVVNSNKLNIISLQSHPGH